MKFIKNGVGWALEACFREPHDVHTTRNEICTHVYISSYGRSCACNCEETIESLDDLTLFDLVALQLFDEGYYPSVHKGVSYHGHPRLSLRVFDNRLDRLSRDKSNSISFEIGWIPDPPGEYDKDIVRSTMSIPFMENWLTRVPYITELGSINDPFLIDRMVKLTHQYFNQQWTILNPVK